MSPSPKPSIDSTYTPSSPTSPFLQNLSHRLRKSSVASHASSRSSETNQSVPDPTDQFPQDAQATKRYLNSILKNDWEYPDAIDNTPRREPSAYRRRDESVSEYDESEKRRRSSSLSGGNPYKFDNPEAIGAYIERRKRRKQRLLDEEMTWNEGLLTWTQRRDAWTGAVAHRPHGSVAGDGGGRRTSKPAKSSKEARHSSQLSAQNQSSSEVVDQIHRFSSASSVPSPLSPTASQEPDSTLNGPYLPIYPPLLPASHNLRSRITPAAYSTIYSRVVIQSLTPNVPVPLDHMIAALVTGWKAEGNWPPQPSEPPVDTLRNGKRKSKRSETAFGRWKREQDEKRTAVDAADDNNTKKRGRIKGLSGAMKRLVGGSKKPEEVVGEEDLEKIGLTFEDENEVEDEIVNGNEHEINQNGLLVGRFVQENNRSEIHAD